MAFLFGIVSTLFFFPLSVFVFGYYISWHTYEISKFLKNNFPDIYTKNSSGRGYLFKDLIAVNVFSISRIEMNKINDEKIVEYIYNFRSAFKIFLVSFFTTIFIIFWSM